MTTTSSSLGSAFSDLRLRDQEGVSPASFLYLESGYDSDGWPIYDRFSVGQVVAYKGQMFKIIGFSTSNELFLAPYGLWIEERYRDVNFIRFSRVISTELVTDTGAGEISRHKDGFVTFGL